MITYSLDLKELGKRIQKLRMNENLSLIKLEHRLKEYGIICARQTLAKYEYGESMPPLDVLCGICNIFNCTFDYLLGVEPYKTKEIDDIRQATGLSTNAIEKLISFEFRTDKRMSFLNALITYKGIGILANEFENYIIQKGEYQNRQQTFRKAKAVEDASIKELIERLPVLYDEEFEETDIKPNKAEWIKRETERINADPLKRSAFYEWELEKLRQKEFAFITEISHFLSNAGE